MEGRHLTRREVEIVAYIAAGLTYKETGSVLQISEQTVKNHVVQIKMKLRARNNCHIVALMMRRLLKEEEANKPGAWILTRDVG